MPSSSRWISFSYSVSFLRWCRSTNSAFSAGPNMKSSLKKLNTRWLQVDRSTGNCRYGNPLPSPPGPTHIRLMAKSPDNPKKPVKTPKSKAPNSRASRPDVQPIGPALAELLNPAINRGESGLGSSTGLRPPPDNSKDRRSGGEAAVHRARASTRGTSDDVAKRDASLSGTASRGLPPPNPRPQAGEGSRRLAPSAEERNQVASSQPASPLPLA